MRKVSARQLALFELITPLRPPAPAAALPLPSQPPEAGIDEAVRRAARELAGDLVLRAGAGTGKTHTLVQAVTHLVAGVTSLSRPGHRVSPSGILILSFSEKAAAELRDRVRSRFVELAAAPRADASLEEAYRQGNRIPLGADAWRNAALSLGAAPITTFHGFAASLLRRHAAACGLDPAFTILDEDESMLLLRARAEEAILAALDERPDEITPLVRDLDFARPPFGRGRALVEHVIAVAERLREEGRVAADLAGEIDDPAEAARLFAEGVAAHARAYDELIACYGGKLADGARAKRDALSDLRPVVSAALAACDIGSDAGVIDAVRRLAELASGNLGQKERNAARDRMREAEAVMRRAHIAHRAVPLARDFLALVERTVNDYQAAKQRLSALDFADLVARARDLLAADPAARDSEAERYDAILVDELQDGNRLQDELVTLLRRPGAPLLAVGDPKQSIYEFRGADVAVFARVAERVAAAGGQVLALTESRRGRAPLTGFVNRLFARVMTGGPHAFQVAFAPDSDALHAHRGGEGSCVELLAGFEPEREPAAVARHIRALVDARQPLVWQPGAGGEIARPARYGDIAILLRRFTHLERFLRELRVAGVPHYVVNGRGFYEAQEVRDVIHALSLIDDADDAVATLGVLRSPLVSLSDPSLFELSKRCGGRLRLAPLLAPGWQPPDGLPAAERERLLEFLALFSRLAASADRLGAAGTLRALVDDTDLAAVLATTHHGEQRIANLERLIGLAADHDQAGRGDRATLARRLRARMARPKSLAAPAQIVGERDDVVRVMTVHQAKGLEFPIVFVPDCGAVEREPAEAVLYDRDAGLGLKLRTASGERVASPRAERALALRRARAAAESARIFYVAVTRARDLLVLSGAASPNGTAPSWRRELDDALAADPATRDLVRAVPVDTAAALAPPPAALTAPQAAPAELPRSLTAPPAPAARLIIPVTELVDLAACPRRHHLRHDIGLVEAPFALDGDGGDEDDEVGLRSAAERGTLAHRLLETVDLAAFARRGPAALRTALERLGERSTDGDVANVVARVSAFLEGRFGRALCARAPGSVRRELPFALAIERSGAPRLLVKGQMDLVLYNEGDDHCITVIDYKLSRPEDAPPGGYRLQLLAYAAAARALWHRPTRAGIAYLRAPSPEPELIDVDDATLDAALDELSVLAGELARARQLASHPGRALGVCQSLRCGYIPHCHATGSRC